MEQYKVILKTDTGEVLGEVPVTNPDSIGTPLHSAILTSELKKLVEEHENEPKMTPKMTLNCSMCGVLLTNPEDLFRKWPLADEDGNPICDSCAERAGISDEVIEHTGKILESHDKGPVETKRVNERGRQE